MNEFLNGVYEYGKSIDFLELLGLIFGLLAVWYLIRQNILTWPSGIIYVLISFVIFWKERLYGDFILHVFFLILNIYGWYYWLAGKNRHQEELPVTRSSSRLMIKTLLFSLVGIFAFGYFLENIGLLIPDIPAASVPYWDAATSVLSVAGMWLTARKKIENWYFWIVVDILATVIYTYKGIYLYASLYGIYIGMAFVGLMAWRKSLHQHTLG